MSSSRRDSAEGVTVVRQRFFVRLGSGPIFLSSLRLTHYLGSFSFSNAIGLRPSRPSTEGNSGRDNDTRVVPATGRRAAPFTLYSIPDISISLGSALAPEAVLALALARSIGGPTFYWGDAMQSSPHRAATWALEIEGSEREEQNETEGKGREGKGRGMRNNQASS